MTKFKELLNKVCCNHEYEVVKEVTRDMYYDETDEMPHKTYFTVIQRCKKCGKFKKYCTRI